MRKDFVALILSGLWSNCFAVSANARKIVHYEPVTVQLVGTIEKQVFPGPPNYRNVANGDRIERAWYLKLNSPVDVIAENSESSTNAETETESEYKVQVLQLAIDYKEPLRSELKNARNGSRVYVEGKLFHRFNGHHHSRVLMVVENMRFTDESRGIR